MSDQQSEFDRLIGSFDGRPDVIRTKESTVRCVPFMGVGAADLFIIQTYREKDKGDFIFFEHVTQQGTTRIVIRPEAAEIIARQHDALTAKSRSRAAKQRAADDKAAGKVPGFMRKKK